MQKFPNEVQFLKPVTLPDEIQRLAVLHRLGGIDSISKAELESIAHLAAEICATPLAAIGVMEADEFIFKTRIGIGDESLPRQLSICAYTISVDVPFIIENLEKDSRFKNHPWVQDSTRLRFYAGVQIRTSDGYNLGTVCVADYIPRSLSQKQIRALQTLAAHIIASIERNSFNKQLEEREKFFNNMFSLVPDLFAYIDQDFRYRYVNAAYERIYRIPKDDILGMAVFELLGKASFELVKGPMQKALMGEEQEFQFCIPIPVEGKMIDRWVWIHFYPDIQANGEIRGIYAVNRNITALKQAEGEALEQGKKLEQALFTSKSNEESFRALFKDSPVAMCRLDSDLNILASNRGFADVLGYSNADLALMNLKTLALREIESENFEIKSDASETIRRRERNYRHKSGSSLLCLETIRQVQDGRGESFFLLILEDITEARSQEAELKTAQAKLFASSKMASLGEMASGVAHEINNPLAIINSKADLIRRKLQAEVLDRDYVDKGLADIKVMIHRIAKIIKGLRHISRGEEGEAFEQMTFAEVMEEATQLCQQRFVHNNIEFSIEGSVNERLDCRPIQITQILINLLNNSFDAIEHLPEKWVRVLVRPEEDKLSIRIVDSGAGIPSAIADRLMEPFYSTKDPGKGTGLGLSISRGMAEAHDGSLEYDLFEGHTSFVLKIPKIHQ
ncbi:MAG: PAS domain S-box protein [Proteobacteria bacterium]|nr:MAG: PAS domain S-box protein [Pseudomonadota bacterium]